MINKHLISLIEGEFKHKPTPSQVNAIKMIVDFLLSEEENMIFVLKGYAGTGKTYLVSVIVNVLESLKYHQVLMAPTGRAAKVFSSYAKKSAYTIHKAIYRQKTKNDGFGVFNLNKNLKSETVFYIDESSMIANGGLSDFSTFGSGSLLEDLISFVFDGNRCKLFLIGDDAQLPPVGYSDSPALQIQHLEVYGANVYECFLDDVVRQENESGILFNANSLRSSLFENNLFDCLPKFCVDRFKDVVRLSGEDLIEEINRSYDTVGIEETLIVNRSNKRTNLYNKGIRNSILYKEEEIAVGDLVLIVKNNYHWLKDSKEVDFIANGDIAEIVRIKGYEQLYDLRFVNCTIRLMDYKELELDVKLLLDALSSDNAGLTSKEQEEFFYKVMEDYQDLSPKKKQYDEVKKNEYYNALQVKFAYAMTCHKAQGGQWKNVFIDPGFVPEESINRDYYRWLYTAITRCKEMLYLVNFKDEYFE